MEIRMNQENEKAIMQLLLEKQYITYEEWFMAVQYIESGADNEWGKSIVWNALCHLQPVFYNRGGTKPCH